MNVIVNVICYKSKVLKNSESPLMVRVCKDRKRKYISLGLSVNPIYWDFKKNAPKPQCPNKEYLDTIIAKTIQEYSAQIIEMKAMEKDFTASTLVEKVSNPTKLKTVGDVFIEQMQALKDAQRLSFVRCYFFFLSQWHATTLTIHIFHNHSIGGLKCLP